MKRLPLTWIWSLWQPHKRLIAPILVLTVANAVAVAAVPLATKGVFDTLAQHVTPETLRASIVWLAAAALLRFVFYALLQNMRAWVNTRLEWTVRSRLFRHLVRMGPSFYGRYATGDLVTRLTDDISDDMKLSWFCCSGVFRFLEALCVVVVVAAAMLRLCVPLALWCLLPLPVLFVVFIRLSNMLDGRYGAQQAAISRINSELEATFNGIRLVKAYTMEAARRQAFQDSLEHRQDAELSAVRGQIWMESLYGYSWQVAVTTVLLVGGYMVISGAISLGDFVAFNGFALSLTFPMFDFGTFLTRGRQALVCIERLRDLEDNHPDVADGPTPAVPKAGLQVAGEGISFRYAGSTHRALRDISLQADRGQFIAVVGRVGQGKTTIMRLLLRLIDPTAGEVRRSGVDVRELTLAAARSRIGYVPQDPAILSDTVEANIRFGRPDISDEQIRWAVAVAQFETDLQGFQDGLQTLVGPRGAQLSGGQKQRVSLARALAGRPEILLLDDCTASLDAATEARLWERLRSELPDTTVVAVTHRTAQLERADRIIVLGDGGAALQSGTHTSLMAQGGEYRKLYERWQKQSEAA